jgi:hypothetical protein
MEEYQLMHSWLLAAELPYRLSVKRQIMCTKLLILFKKAMKLQHLVLFAILLCGACGKDTPLSYPITVNYNGPAEVLPFQILTRSTGSSSLLLVSEDDTTLDELPDWEEALAEGTFDFIRFDNATDAKALFSSAFSTNSDTLVFTYSYQDDNLIFDTDFGISPPTPLELSGAPDDFTIASEIVLIKSTGSNSFSLTPNYTRLGPGFYADFLAEGDTLLVLNYLQRYREEN